MELNTEPPFNPRTVSYGIDLHCPTCHTTIHHHPNGPVDMDALADAIRDHHCATPDDA